MCQNERWRSASRTLLQLGTVLLSATVIEMYRGGRATLETGVWLTIAAGLMYAGWKVLILLESES